MTKLVPSAAAATILLCITPTDGRAQCSPYPQCYQQYLLAATAVAAADNAADYERAIEHYDRAVQLDPNYVEAYVARGGVKVQLQDPQGAIDDCTMAINLAPDATEAYVCRGTARALLNADVAALEDLTKAIALNDTNPDAYVYRGLSLAKLDRMERACADFRQAARLDHFAASELLRAMCN